MFFKVAASQKEFAFVPNRTLAIPRTLIFKGFLFSGTSSSQRNQTASQSSRTKEICKNACSISAVIATAFSLKCNNNSKILGFKFSPDSKQSFKDKPFTSCELQLKTTLNLFVALSSLITAWCGK